MHNFTVAICTFNRLPFLRICLEKICSHNAEFGIPVVIVNNNSTDGTHEFVGKLLQKYSFITYIIEKNKGLSFARNRALQVCSTKYLFFIDDDAYPTDSYLNELSECTTNLEFDSLGGGEIQKVTSIKPKWYPSVQSNSKDTSILKLEEGYLNGYNIGFKTTTLRNLGGFSTRIGMKGKKIAYGEETKVINQIRKNNGLIYFNPKLVVYHHLDSYKLKLSWFFKMNFAQGRDWWRTFEKKSNFIDVMYLAKDVLVLLLTNNYKYLLKPLKKGYYFQNYLIDCYSPIAMQVGRIYGSLYFPYEENKD